MRFAAIVRSGLSTAVVVLGLVVAGNPASAESAGESTEAANRGSVLLLVSERIRGPGNGAGRTRYWWSRPDNPKWTETDRVLKKSLQGGTSSVVEPSGDVRISQIYRTPDLSLNNASSLASILGARRLVIGRVNFRRSRASVYSDLRAVHVSAQLRVVDVTASDPEVQRTVRVRRSVYGPESFDTLVDRARIRAVNRIGTLVGRVLEAWTGSVGIETSAPVFVLHEVRRAAVLSAIQTFLRESEAVKRIRVRWVSEGQIALEIKTDHDDRRLLRRLADDLVENGFDGISVTRRNEGDRDRFEFDVIREDDASKRTSESGTDRGSE